MNRINGAGSGDDDEDAVRTNREHNEHSEENVVLEESEDSPAPKLQSYDFTRAVRCEWVELTNQPCVKAFAIQMKKKD